MNCKWIDYLIIKKSGLFDSDYYLSEYTEVRKENIDPLKHYVTIGWKEGKNPSGLFNTADYLKENEDVNASGVNPLVHYLRFGLLEGRLPGKISSQSKVFAKKPKITLLKLFFFVKKITIKKVFWNFKMYGIKGFLRKVLTKFAFIDGEKDDKSNELEVETNEFGIEKQIKEILGLLSGAPRKKENWIEKPIDILIPVFNGGEYLDTLFQSILSNTKIPYRLLIANDKSTDVNISSILLKFREQNPDVDITIIENEMNLGFVKTVNSLAALTRNHFVILNTDIEVPPNWLERLMSPIIQNEKISCTTPFTNSGTICSFPNFLEDNELFENLDVASLDYYFQLVNTEKLFVEIPTAVGFCMGINWNVYQKIGMFDEIFGKGYGEENDWCMRSLKSGYKSVIVPNLFVYHKHGGSFPSEEKTKLMKKNSDLLRNRHPNYFPLVENYIKRDPLKFFRIVLISKILASQNKPKLIFDHNLGGGANQFTNSLVTNSKITILGRFDIFSKNYKISFCGNGFKEKTFNIECIEEFRTIIRYFEVSEIIVNNLVSYPKILDFLQFLINLKNETSSLELNYIVHDYFSICPIYILLDPKMNFCEVPDNLDVCHKCLKINPLLNSVIPFVNGDYPNLTIESWRGKFSVLLSICSKIICFSQNSIDLMQKAYPNLPLEKFEKRVQMVDWVRPVNITKTTDVINIAIIGNVTIHKGANVVASIATYADIHNLNIKIHIFGEIVEPFESFEFIKTVVEHNKYQKQDLPSLMEDNEIDIVLLPSICPETFSFTAEESMKMSLPVAVFNLGAPAERVKHYEKGIILEEKNPEYILNKIGSYLNKIFITNQMKGITFICVSNNDMVYSSSILSSSYMTEHNIQKFDNSEENVPIPIRYNTAIEKLIKSNYQGWLFFVHNDFSILEPLHNIVNKLDHKYLYGPIGAKLINRKKITYGQILQGDKQRLILFGDPIELPTLVDTVDCQCLFFHTDLLSTYKLRFDENIMLSFHQYVEDFCLGANDRYGIKTFAVPIKCKHLSWGKRENGLELAMEYINSKYGDKWAGTCTHL